MHLKASSAVIVHSFSFSVKACHSRRKENALSFDQVEQMLFNFMKQKQTWKSNYSTVRLFFLVWSSLNFPSVFLCIIGCVIWLVGRFLVHSWSSFLPLYVNLFSYSVSKCWPNYSGIMLLVKGICSTEVPHREIEEYLQAMSYHVGNYSGKKFRSDLTSICMCVTKNRSLYLQVQ